MAEWSEGLAAQESDGLSMDYPWTLKAIPVINIPPFGLEEDEHGYLRFNITSTSGAVEVSAYGTRNFHCLGTAEALTELGLIEPAWLPGLPGNNKVSQTVIFGDGGPSLRIGHKGHPAKSLGPYVYVQKSGKNRFMVCIPTSPAQAQVIDDRYKRWSERRNEEQDRKREEEAAVVTRIQKWRRSVADLRTWTTGTLQFVERWIENEFAGAGYQLDAASARAIKQHMNALYRLCDLAEISRTDSHVGAAGSNVIPFR